VNHSSAWLTWPPKVLWLCIVMCTIVTFVAILQIHCAMKLMMCPKSTSLADLDSWEGLSALMYRLCVFN